MGFPNDDTYYDNPKEQPMIPNTTDLLNLTNNGSTLADRIEASLYASLRDFIDVLEVDVLQLAGDLTENVLQDLVNYDLTQYAMNKETTDE